MGNRPMLKQKRRQPKPAAPWHNQALAISSRLTAYFRQTQQPMAVQVTPERVIEALHRVGVNPVLMGTYGISGWRSEPRATQDVDVLVTKREIPKAGRALREGFPSLSVSDTPVVMRFVDPATSLPVIDLMKPTQRIYQVVFRHTLPVGETHRIPNLEMALISKFAAMVSPNRRQNKKLIDGGDFVDIVIHNRTKIDLNKLQRLADKVYANGGAEMVQLIADIDAGRRIQF
jgi:hypothetical protein